MSKEVRENDLKSDEANNSTTESGGSKDKESVGMNQEVESAEEDIQKKVDEETDKKPEELVPQTKKSRFPAFIKFSVVLLFVGLLSANIYYTQTIIKENKKTSELLEITKLRIDRLQIDQEKLKKSLKLSQKNSQPGIDKRILSIDNTLQGISTAVDKINTDITSFQSKIKNNSTLIAALQNQGENFSEDIKQQIPVPASSEPDIVTDRTSDQDNKEVKIEEKAEDKEKIVKEGENKFVYFLEDGFRNIYKEMGNIFIKLKKILL